MKYTSITQAKGRYAQYVDRDTKADFPEQDFIEVVVWAATEAGVVGLVIADDGKTLIAAHEAYPEDFVQYVSKAEARRFRRLYRNGA